MPWDADISKCLCNRQEKTYGELLEKHQDATQCKAAEKTFVSEEHANLGPAQRQAFAVWMQLGGRSLIKHDGRFDFQPFRLDNGVVDGQSVEASYIGASLLVATFGHQPAGAKRQKRRCDQKNDGRNALQTQGQSPG